ncbi:hypothetical protein SEA_SCOOBYDOOBYDOO_185 [Mycobacterium phage ScoobyDoobyDoo]|nr:hypothetical protein SEA_SCOOBYDOOBYDOO_185 [Mycobacterium phage ScoobyDoobyDoo]
MSNGWKLAALKRRKTFLQDRLDQVRSDGQMHHRATKYDQREYEALEWAISELDTAEAS